jgi:streptogramin lyase
MITPTVIGGVTTWVVTTLAGSPGPPGSANGTGSAAQFNSPNGVAVDDAGNVYVADTGNNAIRMITPTGDVSTLAGSFNAPSGVAVDDAGNVYVADTGNNTIRMITPTVIGGVTTWVVTTLAGSPGPPGSADGTGGTALFNAPKAVAVDSAGDVYVADTGNNTIREITPTGLVTTLAGSPGSAGSADGMGNAARFTQPGGLATYTTGNLYVADTGNDTIRKITPSGVVATLAGSVGSAGSADGTSAARFNSPTGLAVSRGGIKNLTQRPRNLTVFCNGSTQSTIDTSIAFYGAVYAPNSPLVVNVNLTVYGALVGQSVTFNGTPTIHYDLDLRKATFSVVNTPYDVWQWNVSN